MSKALGQPFSVVTSLPIADAKRLLRDGMLNPFGSLPGFHGALIGPFLLLFWRPTMQSHGHILIGQVKQDGVETRVTGRFGIAIVQSLCGWALIAVLLYLLVLSSPIIDAEDFRLWSALPQFAALAVLGYALAAWVGGFDPENADAPLRYIERRLGN